MRAPVLPSAGALLPLGTDDVHINGGFWGQRQEVNAAATLPHILEWVERMGWIDNLRLAKTDRLPAERRGLLFTDSDVYKLVEAQAWEAARGGDTSLDDAVDSIASVLAAAQESDGYLNTMFGRPGQAGRYTDPRWGHELYDYGHLIQAGVARLRTRGDDTLTGVVRRVADHVCVEFGVDGRQGVCGHPEIEMALVELFRETGEQRYLDQAKLFVDRRGYGVLGENGDGGRYYQDDVPVRSARSFAGHAVRALYLACGAVDVAVETGDDELLTAVVGQWERTVATRTYLTGGMGSRHSHEDFGDDYELPPERAYAETCAGIASVMLSWRLLLATGEARFADLAERTLYNVVAAAPSLDGKAFYYANPLQVREAGSVPDPSVPSRRAGTGLRAPWFECSCCPTNIARTIATLGGYLATVDDSGLQLQQYAAGEIAAELPGGRRAGVRLRTSYPWDGQVRVEITETDGGPWRLGLRIPAWAADARISSSGEWRPVPAGDYVTVERAWQRGDEVVLDLSVRPRWTFPDPRIDAVRDCVAVERGPLVYCAESIDLDDGVSLDQLTADPAPAPAEVGLPVFGADVVGVTVSARTRTAPDQGWPYGHPVAAVEAEETQLRLIPYPLRANRRPTQMRVFLPASPGT